MRNETHKLAGKAFEDSCYEEIFSLYDSIHSCHVAVCSLYYGGWLFCGQLRGRDGLQCRQHFVADYHQFFCLGNAAQYRHSE